MTLPRGVVGSADHADVRRVTIWQGKVLPQMVAPHDVVCSIDLAIAVVVANDPGACDISHQAGKPRRFAARSYSYPVRKNRGAVRPYWQTARLPSDSNLGPVVQSDWAH